MACTRIARTVALAIDPIPPGVASARVNLDDLHALAELRAFARQTLQ